MYSHLISGKTVILKLLGLCALMARDGIPIPATPDDARVDFFGPVLADIGDLQSVDEDLSTFSGHMVRSYISFSRIIIHCTSHLNL